MQTEKAVYTDDTKATLSERTVKTYNVMGRLKKIETDSDGDGTFDSTIEYSYADNGLRISTTEDGTTTLHHFNTMNPTGHAQVLEEGVDADAAGRRAAARQRPDADAGADRKPLTPSPTMTACTESNFLSVVEADRLGITFPQPDFSIGA